MSRHPRPVVGGRTHRTLFLLVAVGVVALAAASPVASASGSPRATGEVMPAGKTLGGAGYDEWLNRWEIWALATPTPTNPLAQAKRCQAPPQPFTKVWLLSTWGGGKITITCTIPAGRALFVPLVVNTLVENEKLDTFAKLRSQARTVFNDTKALRVTIDGAPIASPTAYRATTRDLTLAVPADNILGVPAGKVKAMGAGYALLVTGLTPGKHEIVVSATIKPKGRPAFESGQRYRLTIE
jgi:hypothetical protein